MPFFEYFFIFYFGKEGKRFIFARTFGARKVKASDNVQIKVDDNRKLNAGDLASHVVLERWVSG